MAVNKPDIYQHNNPNLAFVDSDFIKGGIRTSVANLAALYALSGKTGTQYAPGQLKNRSTIVYVSGETKYYILKDINNANNANGWEIFVTGGGNGTLTGATNGISLVNGGTTVSLGGALTGNTSLTGNYTLNICNNAKLNSNCGYQISGVTFFDATRNSLSNVAIGQCALKSNTTGLCNVAIGSNTLYNNVSGIKNIAIGNKVFSGGTINCNNIAIGSNINSNYSGFSNNIIIGNGSLSTGCAKGNNLINIGTTSSINMECATQSIGIGASTFYYTKYSCYNIGLGVSSMSRLISGSTNIGIGIYSLQCNSYGCDNIGIGSCVGRKSSGNTNIFIGNCAGYNTMGSGKLYIGTGNTSLIMGDMSLPNECVILPYLKLRCTPTDGTSSDSLLSWDNSTCLVRKVNSINQVNVVDFSTTTYTAMTNNDFIGASGGTVIYLPNPPKSGQRIIVADIAGNALSNPIIICGNNKNILSNTSAIINTDYGSITLIYNSKGFWSAAAFIN